MKDAIRNLAERIAKTSGMVQTEEATKNAYIMPFLQILGDRKSTRLNSSHYQPSRMPSSA